MSMSINVHAMKSMHTDLWESRGTTGVDLVFTTDHGAELQLTLFCRQPLIARAYADAINSVGRGHSPYDAELDGVADAISMQEAA